MKKLVLQLGALAVFCSSFYASCSKQEDLDPTTDPTILKAEELSDIDFPSKDAEKLSVFKGPQVQLGLGKVRSFVSLDEEDFPVEIGIIITQEVLEDTEILPADHHTTVLPLHQKAQEVTPFEHIGVNWQPHGHLPVFLVPHFDLHFYMISNEERLAIPEYSPETDAAFNLFPPEGYMPDNYVAPPGQGAVYAQMGKHWLPQDLGNYLPFTKIMVLGTYNGEFNFIEPMITLDYLLTGAEFSDAYAQPEIFQEATNYPTVYNMYRDLKTGDLYITLSDFVTR